MPKRPLKAIEALEEAQKIAFAPFIFQTTITLKKLGVLNFIFDSRKKGGTTIKEIAESLSISIYGVGVLLELAESSNIVDRDEKGRFELTKTGYFLNYNETANVNMNFTNKVCYKGLSHLTETIKTGKPEGLKELGNWNTIYEGLSQLTPEVQKAWFEFDHHYSDDVFDEALKIVYRSNPKTVFDVGGNTGKFALASCKYKDDLHVKIIDLPGQLNKALTNAKAAGFSDRVSGHEIDWLSDNPQIPKGAETVWMSQFLDCFSEDEILKIITTCANAMNDDAELLIMETFTDRQKFDNAKFILEATSIYFTVMANGNSKMYPSTVFKMLIDKAGLIIKEDISVGQYHTIFVCKKR